MRLSQIKAHRNYVQDARKDYKETIGIQPSLLAPLPPSERNDRIERGREDVAWWLPTYLPQYFTFPFSQVHKEVFELFYVKGQLCVIILPRDAGKGTTLFGLTLHGLAYDLLPFPTRAEYNFDVALQELYKFEDALTNNPRFLADYALRPGSPWRASKGLLTLNNGRQLRFIGMDQVARGTVSLNFRIDPLIANDLESLTSVRSPTQTQKTYDFITKDIAHAGAALSEGGHTYIYVGTKLSKNCATQQMIDSPMAESYEFPAIIGEMDVIKELMDVISHDAGNMRDYNHKVRESRKHLPRSQRNPTSEDRQRYIFDHSIYHPFLEQLESYWTERFALWDLCFEAAKGTDVFMQEMMHNPGDAKFLKFYEHWFVPYDGFLPLTFGGWKYGMGIDTSGEPKEGSDPMAIVAGAYNTDTEDFYILEVWCAQATPEELVETAHNIYFRHFRSQGREANAYLEAIVSATGLGRSFFRQTAENQINQGSDKELWEPLPIYEINPQLKKEVRLMAMRPIAEQRRIHVIKGHSQQNLLIRQWCNWTGESTHKVLPIEYKIDGPDAMTMLFQNISKRRQKPVAGEPRYRHMPPQHRATERYLSTLRRN